jgi:hypothetical protein
MKITMIRNKGYYGRMRTAKIIADDNEIGLIKSGETVNIKIPEQANNIYIKMDWAWSEPYPTNKLKEGQTIYINAWVTFNPLRSFGIMTIPIAFENKPR